jgi:hypothetical protein
LLVVVLLVVVVRTCKEEKFLSVARNWDIIRTGEDNKQKSLLYIKKELQGTEKGWGGVSFLCFLIQSSGGPDLYGIGQGADSCQHTYRIETYRGTRVSTEYPYVLLSFHPLHSSYTL